MTSVGRKLTPAEAVEYLAAEFGIEVHTDTIRRWCRHGTITRISLPGGRFLIPVEVLDELAAPERAVSA